MPFSESAWKPVYFDAIFDILFFRPQHCQNLGGRNIDFGIGKFAGNEGTNSMTNMPEGEQEDEMSLYNFKLAGLISGKDHSYISVVSSAGEAITLTLGQYLGKNQFIDLRLTEAIFKKEDGKYLILDFNNQIREADDY